MPVGDYCRRNPVTVEPEDTVQEAAKRMDETGVGCLVVVDGAKRVLGVVTDRDVALRVLRRGIDASAATVETVMRAPAVTISENGSLEVAARFMRQHGIRRIPVVDNETGAVTGIIASDDLVQLMASELSASADVLHHQLPTDPQAERTSPPGREA